MKEQVDIDLVLHEYGLVLEYFDRLEGGLINDTYLATCEGGYRVVVQKLRSANSREHIDKRSEIIGHLQKSDVATAKLLITKHDDNHVVSNNHVWIVSEYVDNDDFSKKNHERLYSAGKTLAQFHVLFKDYPNKHRFYDHDFHNTHKILTRTREIVDKEGGLDSQLLLNELEELVVANTLPDNMPQTLIHGDPKFNNFLFKGNNVVAIIDLDTVMCGSELIDLGDAIRSWCRVGEISFDIGLFRSAIDGYCSYNNQPYINENVGKATRLITAELATRFLADCFTTEPYFQWDRNRYNSAREHNWARAMQYLNYCQSIPNDL